MQVAKYYEMMDMTDTQMSLKYLRSIRLSSSNKRTLHSLNAAELLLLARSPYFSPRLVFFQKYYASKTGARAI